jgi:antitoxin component of RelBE/YafQ-DinJ toxin-antitoxin module
MESGNVPSWAKPAYDAVNQKLAQRGLEVSTVGRDALFNAIIQNAIPIAQSNAQALQARATQNLSNEQQANMERAQIEANRRLTNLGNLQTAGSQTAQMSQNLKLAQSQFKQ